MAEKRLSLAPAILRAHVEFGPGFPFYGGSGQKNVEIKAGVRRLFFFPFLDSLLRRGAVRNWGSVFRYSLTDALDSSSSIQTIQKTTTRRIVDGKVVSETNDTKVLRR